MLYEPSAFTLIRLTLPRRSLVFSADRRASTNGALNRLPCTVRVDGDRRARVPVSPDASAVGCVDVLLEVLALPEQVTLAVLTGTAGGGQVVGADGAEGRQGGRDGCRGGVPRDRRRGLAAEGQREGAAGAAVDADRLGLGRLHVVVRREAARVPAAGGRVVAGDEPEVVVLVEVDVTADVAAGTAVVGDLEDLLLRVEVERGGVAGPSTNLNRDSWK